MSDAQLAIGREYGFPTWASLKAHVENPNRDDLALLKHERIKDLEFRAAVDLLDAGDTAGLQTHLERHPRLTRQRLALEGGNYFSNPTLLEFVAENPTRRGSLPRNIVQIAKIILAAGAGADQAGKDSTLALVSSSSVARESEVQVPLIELLCDYGAAADEGMLPALLYGEFEAVDELIRRGAKVDLAVAAATGRIDVARNVLPVSSGEARQGALALAAQYGHIEIVRLLLDAGEDPNRYSPVGGHSQATPLHQAAIAGHDGVVRLLVERGARLDIHDILYNGTPLDWANYAKNAEIAEYLRTAASVGKRLH